MGQKITGPLNLQHVTDAEMLALVSTAQDGDMYFNSDQGLEIYFYDGSFYTLDESPAYVTLFSENRESGNFTANSWTVVNDDTNEWVVGTADKHQGTYGCYISDDGGTTAGYDPDTAQVSHIYKDFTIGSSVSDLAFKARWKTVGESGYDFMRTFIAPTSVTPVAGTQVNSSYQVGPDWNGNGSWSEGEFSLGNAYSGTTIRLIISWVNDGSIGTDPGGLFDEFRVLYR